MLTRLLIANRGEIALRVMRAARELGIPTVGVYAPGDERSLHLQHCDQALRLDSREPASAYLSADAILAAAASGGADAIHPGYGFLSENPAFARRVEQAGLAFVGPRPETMQAFGVKTNARAMMEEAGVPTVPGTTRPVNSPEAARSEAERVGYPVLLKASYGGGGRGIRAVASEREMAAAFETASREAVAAFGNGELYLEKLLERPRHIEVQILGDGKGAAVHLYERDCSMQRRHQKLIEESPAPNLDSELRVRLLADAVRAARAGNYRSAGTVEFLVAGDRHFFLEVNARLQVEHPVSEAVTGIDLVRAQLRLAAGDFALPAQGDIAAKGHAIECRINAEDARLNFLPCPGWINRFVPPTGPGVRVDAGVAAGGEVSQDYDSLLAKLIVHAENRGAAILRLRRALGEFVITGVPTTIPFHRFAIESAGFSAGNYSISTVAEFGALPEPSASELRAVALAAVVARALRPPTRAAVRSFENGERGKVSLRPPFGPQRGGWFHEL